MTALKRLVLLMSLSVWFHTIFAADDGVYRVFVEWKKTDRVAPNSGAANISTYVTCNGRRDGFVQFTPSPTNPTIIGTVSPDNSWFEFKITQAQLRAACQQRDAGINSYMVCIKLKFEGVSNARTALTAFRKNEPSYTSMLFYPANFENRCMN